jgi:monoterpene epsilon-lactone hydrolase
MRAARDANRAAEPAGLAETRAFYDAHVASSATEPSGVTWHEDVVSGVSTIVAQPLNAVGPRPVIEFLHGGGFSLGSAQAYKNFTGHIAKAVGCRVVSVDYRLAPEHPYPAGLLDAVSVYLGLVAAGTEPRDIALMGDSAGGGLALSTVLKLRVDGIAQPRATVAMSPWADLDGQGASTTRNAACDLLATTEGLAQLKRDYVGTRDISGDPLASPVAAEYVGVCPIYIQVGGDEILLDDSLRVRDSALGDGVDAVVDVFPSMQHVFQMYAGRLPEADKAIDRIADYLNQRWETT